MGRSMGVEIIATIGGGALVSFFNPYTTITWALGIWLFFIIQSVYFIILENPEIADETTYEPDAFDRARIRAERVLKG